MKLCALFSHDEGALDALNIFLADMRDGVGPYLTLYLLHVPDWSPSKIGWALAAASFATLLGTAPAGYVLDRSRNKIGLVALAALTIAFSTALLLYSNQFWPVITLQSLSGLASAWMGPGIVAISLGIVGPRALPSRIGRNEALNHAGNFGAAILTSFLVRYFDVSYAFGFVILMSLLSSVAVLKIRSSKINHSTARSLAFPDAKPFSLLKTLSAPRFFPFLVLIWAFQLSNASLLSIAAQGISSSTVVVSGANPNTSNAAVFLSTGIVVAQLTAIPVAWMLGAALQYLSVYVGLAVGLLAVLLRCLIFAWSQNVTVLIAAQIFDGIAAGVMAVAPILVVYDITKGSGRFTFAAGVMAAAIGLGASFSNLAAGYVMELFGYQTCLLSLGSVALASLLLLTWLRRSQVYLWALNFRQNR